MQLQGFMLMLFMIAVVPIMALSANHEVFFILMSLILLVFSIRNVYRQLTGKSKEESDPDSEFLEEAEEMLDLDMKKFGTGLRIVKNLSIILFLAYCSFYMDTMLFRGIVSAAILFQVYFTIHTFKSQQTGQSIRYNGLKQVLSSLLIIAVILAAALNKLTQGKN